MPYTGGQDVPIDLLSATKASEEGGRDQLVIKSAKIVGNLLQVTFEEELINAHQPEDADENSDEAKRSTPFNISTACTGASGF